MDSFHKIGIIGKYADNSVSETLRALSDYLQTREVEVLLDDATGEFWPVATSSAASAT